MSKSATRRGGKPSDGRKVGPLPPKFPKIEQEYQKKLHNLILKNQDNNDNHINQNHEPTSKTINLNSDIEQIDYKPLLTEGAVLPKGLEIQNK